MRYRWLMVVGISGLGLSLLGFGFWAPRASADDPAVAPVINMSRLNTAADEDEPYLAPGGLQFFFTTNGQGKSGIWMADRRMASQPFTSPRVMDNLCHGKADDGSPCPAGDGQYIYFATKRYGKDFDNYDIVFSRRLDPTAPYSKSAIAPINTIATEADELHPWVSADLRELYFSRKTEEGWRIYVASGAEPRAFDKVEAVDLPSGFHRPCLTADRLTMYVQGPYPPESKDRLGLYVSRRTGRGAAWSKPEPLTRLNTADGAKGDRSPSLSPDGNYLYFASDRMGGKGGLDLYVVAVAEIFKANK